MTYSRFTWALDSSAGKMGLSSRERLPLCRFAVGLLRGNSSSSSVLLGAGRGCVQASFLLTQFPQGCCSSHCRSQKRRVC